MRLKSIAEMASIKGWHPTQERTWVIFNGDSDDGDLIDSDMQAHTEQEAIQKYAKEYSIDPSTITAKLAEDADIDFDNFRANDLKSINSDKTIQKITQWLNNNNTPYEWIFHFNPTENIKPTPGAITFLKYGNVGGDVLTPHMILHTAGHAIVQYDTHLTVLLVKFARAVNPHEDMIQTVCKFLHMRAAYHTLKRNERFAFPSIDEIINEMCAIYIKNGKVKFSPNEYYDNTMEPNKLAALVLKMQKEINSYFKNELDDAVGKVVVDA